LASAFLLFGMALVYAVTGAMDFAGSPGTWQAPGNCLLWSRALADAGRDRLHSALCLSLWTRDVMKAHVPILNNLQIFSKTPYYLKNTSSYHTTHKIKNLK
jgi:NADH:ubiquinone oxidoreductase subunit 2 (subunit N)